MTEPSNEGGPGASPSLPTPPSPDQYARVGTTMQLPPEGTQVSIFEGDHEESEGTQPFGVSIFGDGEYLRRAPLGACHGVHTVHITDRGPLTVNAVNGERCERCESPTTTTRTEDGL